MKKTKAKLIFATTTPVGPRAARKNADVIRYNAAARKVMQAEKVPINDLYAIAAPIRLVIIQGYGLSECERQRISEIW